MSDYPIAASIEICRDCKSFDIERTVTYGVNTGWEVEDSSAMRCRACGSNNTGECMRKTGPGELTQELVVFLTSKMQKCHEEMCDAESNGMDGISDDREWFNAEWQDIFEAENAKREAYQKVLDYLTLAV